MERDNIFGISGQALKIFAKRADILSNNLANASTPNFKARDIDFKETLNNLNSGESSLITSHPNHVNLGDDSQTPTNLLYRVPLQPSMDGNTVDSDIERVKFMENAMKYQVSLNFVSSTATRLKKAFQGE